MGNVVLFDMDGTLTEARMPMKQDMARVLTEELAPVATWGIVTGSGLNYLLEQCSKVFDKNSGLCSELAHLLPCNGTQYWTFESYDLKKKDVLSMREVIGEDNFRTIIEMLIDIQSFTAKTTNIPLSGHFISDRGSTINWCPIGREATPEMRAQFVTLDQRIQLREDVRNTLLQSLKDNKCDEIEITLGGQTSLDIYPAGWDKTFALSRFPNDLVWFVGDKCTGTGNDRAIFEVLQPVNRSFQTTSPEETMCIIREEIIPRIVIKS